MRCIVSLHFLLVALTTCLSVTAEQPEVEEEATVVATEEPEVVLETTVMVVEQQEVEVEAVVEPVTESVSKKKKKTTQNSTIDVEYKLRVIEHTLPVIEVRTRAKKTTRPYIRRRKILEPDYIFPRKGFNDPYSTDLFNNVTGLEAKRVFRKSSKKIHAFMKALNFRAFIREMNLYVQKIAYPELIKDPAENVDGLFYRTTFYLLLRALAFTPTDYFQDLWEKYGLLAVETPATVFLFAVTLGSDAKDDFKVAYDLVESPDGSVLPRDTKTILCAGISFDRDFDCKIRHWKAVLRDKTIVKSTENATETDR